MKNILEKFDNIVYSKPTDFDKEKCDESEVRKFMKYLELIIDCRKTELLFRGTRIDILKSKLITKLNSNNSLFDGLFLVGEKAKNYLEKASNIPHQIKVIDSLGDDVANWIFDEYSSLPTEKIKNDYFKIENNRHQFVRAIKNDRNLIDYYLVGLHKWDSNILVNFVSTTSKLEVALSNGNDLIILLWLSECYSTHAFGETTVNSKLKKISAKKLPKLIDFFEKEFEYSFKGFVLPHFILGVFSVNDNTLIINPALLKNEDLNWIINGFEINNDSFLDFIKTTKYKRFLSLHSNESFEEKSIC